MSPRERVETAKQFLSKHPLLFADFFFKNEQQQTRPAFHKTVSDQYMTGSNSIIVCPRGHGKSILTDVFYLAWKLLTGNCKFAIIISNTYDQAVLQLDSLKDILQTNQGIIGMYGKQQSDKWREDTIVLSNGSCVMARGQGQQIRGLRYLSYRPQIIIGDDLESEESVRSKESRDAVENWIWKEIFPSLDPQIGQAIFIGTILHDDSIMNRMLHNPGYEKFKKLSFASFKEDGTPLWPERFPIETLREIERGYVLRGQADIWAREYMSQPIAAGSAVFKKEHFKYYKNLDGINIKSKFMTVDLALGETKRSDNTVLMTIGISDTNQWYILDCIAEHLDPLKTIDAIFKQYEKWHHESIGIETVAYQKSMMYYLSKEMRNRAIWLPLTQIKSTKSKDLRIDGLRPVYLNGDIFHRDNGRENKLEEELLSYPRGLHDDAVDALAMQLALAKYERSNVPTRELTNEDKWKLKVPAKDGKAWWRGKEWFNNAQ